MTEKYLSPVALITGASKRIGKQIAIELHAAGYNIALHFNHSQKSASTLAETLNLKRKNSCSLFQADLLNTETLKPLIENVAAYWGQLDLLINNASTFFPSPISDQNNDKWDNLMGTNLKAPYYLSLAALPYLIKTKGNIINIADIYGIQPLANHSIYSMAKAALIMMTKALATEFSPKVRVNAVAPGAILWPENNSDCGGEQQLQIIKETALNKQGSAADISKTVRFLATNADYITGQVIRVDGGRF